MDRKEPLSISLITLGCKVNQSDAASLASELKARGHRVVYPSEPADVTIIHTCTVTQKTDYQSRQLIRRVVASDPARQVIVTGCYAQVSPESLQEIAGIDFIVGIHERTRIPQIVSRGKCATPYAFVSPSEETQVFEENLSPFTGRTRAYLKVQDGCDSFCSYCLVPFARGRNRSFPLDRALARAGELSRQGFQEVVLTGIHLGTYGQDLTPPITLLDLLRALEGEQFNFRLRLSSIEPAEFTPELIRFLAASPRICPHLHIPLQSGDDGILQEMNRNYSSSFFEDLVRRLVRSIPGVTIGVDVIGGFPGEDEQAFGNTMQLIESLPLAYLHVFPFSRRKGTPAFSSPGQVPSRVIKDRCRALRELGWRKKSLYHTSFLGRTLQVLVESKRDRDTGMLKGYSQNYIPVLIPGGEEWMNHRVDVEVTELRDGRVLGKIRS